MDRTSSGFFHGRVQPKLGPPGDHINYFYVNIPPIIGWIVGSRHATLYELQTVYGVRDAYDLLEIIMVDNANERAAIKKAQRKTR